MKFHNQFNHHRTLYFNSGKVHKGFVSEPPLTISEMMYRAQKGIPLSVPKNSFDKLSVNDKFYSDDFDILDIALRNEKRLSEEQKQALLVDRKRSNELIQQIKDKDAEIEKMKTLASKIPSSGSVERTTSDGSV